MPRALVVKSETDLQSLSASVLDGRFKGAQADAAVSQLKQLNPHVDFDRLTPGEVVLVPDTPAVKATAGTSVQGSFLDDFKKLVTSALSDAAADVKTGVAARTVERASVAEALGSAAFKAAAANDPLLRQQGDEAEKIMAAEESDDKQAASTVTAISRAALASLERLDKLAR